MLGNMEIPELVEIDRQSAKARMILDEARRLKALDHDLAVRRSQEAFELYLKSLFRFLEADYPAAHDVGKQIYSLAKVLKRYQIDRRLAAVLVLANSTLAVWRSPAFYGDEKLNVGAIFNDAEAALAISYAEKAEMVCGIVRGQVYTEASTQKTLTA